MTGVTFSPKPEGAVWTDDQWRAVSAEGSNILVAAAAGSGKTAVLVERIIRKISNDTDVDRLLVATFTKAAASEMKERVRIALEGALERSPDSEHLRRQLALINRSSITTLHSFCLDVIRSYYPLIGLDPGFRMAGETESELLRIDALDALFEHKYTGEDADSGVFMMLADRYGGERGDEPLYRLVQKLYDFSRSNPWPDHWLRETAARFRIAEASSLGSSEWVEAAKTDVHLSLIGAVGLLEQALELTRRPAGPAPYAETLSDDLNMVSNLLGITSVEPWETWAETFAAISFGKLKSMRGDEYDKVLQQRVKDLRDKVKDLLSGVVDRWFRRTPEQYLEELEELTPMMETLSELVIDFAERYTALKRDKGLLDFSDLEHGCLSILRDPRSTPEKEIPSAAAREYQERFVEILLDEYQDTNTVQEAIVSLIARADNRFMVGDVKQSIYRFRLAEPNLFLHKYKTYTPADLVDKLVDPSTTHQEEQGVRIDLARNFRSRSEVVDGVNGIFRAVMRESVGELEYDERAELVCGASYPPPDIAGRCAAELVLVDRNGAATQNESDLSDDYDADSAETEEGAPLADAADLQTAQLEARVIARRILDLISEGHPVWDGKRKQYRPLQMRDIVILLRATASWAPILIEELQTFGIPAYAELGTGYFDATEVEVMMSLLRVIDNPYQDIPLAGVLRSPIFGLTAEELAKVRIEAGRGSFYDAVRRASVQPSVREEIRLKLDRFLSRLEQWRETARQGSVTEMLAALYRETGYYDFVGGLPGGLQRQANLRALLDRARQYESTSFRGLFRFLRFIERMRDTGGDLGTARALGEQEDVVRIMSIHKSKGLEFPVVFVAGLGKMFNMQDLNAPFLLHKELGYGPKFVDAKLRVSYPTLPCLAIGRKLRMEMLAEEMRILYVALTRPKEKMILVGTLKDAVAKLEEWSGAVDSDNRLSDDRLAAARSYIDWIGPLAAGSNLISTSVTTPSDMLGETHVHQAVAVDHSLDGRTPVDRLPLMGWRFAVMPASLFAEESAIVIEADEQKERDKRERMQAVNELAILEFSDAAEEVDRLLSWSYRYSTAASVPAKTSVTEMKRLHAEREEEAALLAQLQELDSSQQTVSESTDAKPTAAYTFRLRRPRFMEENALTAAERGTASHLLMQHVPLDKPVTLQVLQALVDELIARQIMTLKQAEAISLEPVVELFAGPFGQRILRADWVKREVPFSCTFPAARIYGVQAEGSEDEPILIQGVVDCLFRDQEGIVLLDYKTDQVYAQQWEQAAEKHRFQLELYAEALELSLGMPIQESYVHFLSGGVTVRLR